MTKQTEECKKMEAVIIQGIEPDILRGDPTNYVCCLVPTFVDGADGTHCYYVDGRDEIIPRKVKHVLRDLVQTEGLCVSPIRSMTGLKPVYTDPRTYGPHMTFACLKVRQSIGRSVVYGLFNVVMPHNYKIHKGPTADTCYVLYDDFDPILVYHAPHHVQRKLTEAVNEHMCYMRRWFAYLTLTRNRFAVSELFNAWNLLARS